MLKFLDGLASLRSPFHILMVFFTSILIWLLETVKYWFVMHAFTFSVSFFALMLLNGIANLATTIPFVLAHAFTSYSTDTIVFLALQTLPVSLAWCWLMQKTRSVWGSILFHAAMDIPIFVGLFSQM